PRFDGDEPVGPVRAGQHAPGPGEVGVERGRVLVVLVPVAPAGVGLPDLDERIGQRPAGAVEHPAVHDDPFPEWLAAVLAGPGAWGWGPRGRSERRTGPVTSRRKWGSATSGGVGARSRVDV